MPKRAEKGVRETVTSRAREGSLHRPLSGIHIPFAYQSSFFVGGGAGGNGFQASYPEATLEEEVKVTRYSSGHIDGSIAPFMRLRVLVEGGRQQ